MEAHVQDIALETLSVARLTFQHEVGHELHFYGHGAFAFTFLAAPALGVEREMAGGEAHLLGQGLFGKQTADLIVGLDVDDGV